MAKSTVAVSYNRSVVGGLRMVLTDDVSLKMWGWSLLMSVYRGQEKNTCSSSSFTRHVRQKRCSRSTMGRSYLPVSMAKSKFESRHLVIMGAQSVTRGEGVILLPEGVILLPDGVILVPEGLNLLPEVKGSFFYQKGSICYQRWRSHSITRWGHSSTRRAQSITRDEWVILLPGGVILVPEGLNLLPEVKGSFYYQVGSF